MAKRSKPGGGNPSRMDVMQQIQQLQEQMLKAQEELADERVTGSAGGGALKVIVTGDQRIIDVVIAPELMEDADLDLLQDLFLAASNQALDKSRELATKKLGPLAGQGLPF